ncbi:MAG: pantoate--beta-alanine ligase [bacterium]
MQITTDTNELRRALLAYKLNEERIAFIPTMGNLHEGHLYLVKRAKALAKRVVVSIFVNPIQFDRAEDLNNYPRTEHQDQEKLQALGVDVLFMPQACVMYPNPKLTMRIFVGELGDILEGQSRDGHFSGVATVVNKLFNLVQPDVALFGEKDFQQLMIIRQMVDCFEMPIEIVGIPTVRESDGLAMSSRNGYLTSNERVKAPHLYQSLAWIAEKLERRRLCSEELCMHLEDAAHDRLLSAGLKPDYITVRRQVDLQQPWQCAGRLGNDDEANKKLVVLGSAWLGKARLIDNIPLTV